MADWLVAIGTIALALTTVVVSLIVPWWRRPRFKIDFENIEPYRRLLEAGSSVKQEYRHHPEIVSELVEPVLVEGTRPESFWLRLKVTNEGGSVAKNCSGRLVEFFNDRGFPIQTHDLVKLHWINTPWSQQEYFQSIDLNRKEHDFLDVLVTRVGFNRPILFISPDNLFGNNPDMVPLGTSRIQVTIYGDNVDPSSQTYDIIWDNATDITSIRLEPAK